MIEQGTLRKFQVKVQQRQRAGYQVVSYTEDPPRAKLRVRSDQLQARKRLRDQRSERVSGMTYSCIAIWIDEEGELHDEDTDC
jgi:hypothetical protein